MNQELRGKRVSGTTDWELRLDLLTPQEQSGNLLDSIFRWDMYERFNYTLKEASRFAAHRSSMLVVARVAIRWSLPPRAARVVGLDIAERMVTVCASALNGRLCMKKTSSFRPTSPTTIRTHDSTL